jgi:flavin-dependent dehydrogenase
LYDIIIIGTGPAGSSAAKELAVNGYNVLIVEKCDLPRNKSCSGILIKKSIRLIELNFCEQLPRSVMCQPAENKGMVLTNDEGKEYIYEQEGINIWRSELDYWLVKKAVSSGCELRDETTVSNCREQDDCVIVKLSSKEKGEYFEKAKIVIDCSGAVYATKRKLMHCKLDYIHTYQTFNKGYIGLDEHYFYAYLQPQFSEYDAWFNVKDDYLIFGVSVKNIKNIPQYYSRFVDYMTKKHNLRIDRQERKEKWIMPHILPGYKINYGIGRVLFAGEAAGFLNPMGEGISAALESGFAAARAIRQSGLNAPLNPQTIHGAYRDNTTELKNYMQRQWRLVAGLSLKFSHMKKNFLLK